MSAPRLRGPGRPPKLCTPEQTTGPGRKRQQCRLKGCEDTINSLRAELESAKAELKARPRDNRASLRESGRSSEIAKKEAELCSSEAEIKSLRHDLKEAHWDRSFWKRQVDVLGEEVERKDSEITELLSRIATLTKRITLDAAKVARQERHLKRMFKTADGERQAEVDRVVAAADLSAQLAVKEEAAARDEAAAAREDAIARAADNAELKDQLDSAQRAVKLLERKCARAQSRAGKALAQPPASRTAEEWTALKRSAKLMATKRERDYLGGIFDSHSFRMSDLAYVLDEPERGRTDELFNTKPIFTLYVSKVRTLMRQMETEDYGIEFGMFLHFELHIPVAKIVRITQAASKSFFRFQAEDGSSGPVRLGTYRSKPLLHNPYLKGDVVHVARIAPPRSKLEPAIRAMEQQLGVRAELNGRVALRLLTDVVNDLLIEDPGIEGRLGSRMPDLPQFLAGVKLPLVISRDATGKGSLQFNTIVLHNPYATKSAQKLRIFGLGLADDHREGSKQVFGPENLATIDSLIQADERDEWVGFDVGPIKPMLLFVDDVCCLRHGEHIANSGWCSCSRDHALHHIPKSPVTVEEMYTELENCTCPVADERTILSHSKLNGRIHPCPAPGCTFGHDPNTADAEYEEQQAKIKTLEADSSKSGKTKYRQFRMDHAHSHLNIQPGEYGAPFIRHNLNTRQILDPLHYAKLGLPKSIPWKHGLLNNSSDDARDAISNKLKEWKHPLDTRRKDNNRLASQKWFTGERFGSFLNGTCGSPGGPIAIATLVMIVADDLQLRGVSRGAGTPDEAVVEQPTVSGNRGGVRGRASRGGASRGGPSRGGRGRGAFMERRITAADKTQLEHPGLATEAELLRMPTRLERKCDDADLQVIKDLFGSRAQTLINILLAWDSFFNWYFPLQESIPFLAPMDVREARALENMQLAIEMKEQFERISIRKSGSFLPHAATHKVTRDILSVGDIWATGLDPLELQNAETKRVAESSGSRRLEFSKSGQARHPLTSGAQGPAQLVTTVGYSTTTAVSTLKHLLMQNQLRRGDGLYKVPDSRRTERLMEHGRTKHASTGIKLEKLALVEDYSPMQDTSLKAFVRMCAGRARQLSAES